MTGAQLEVVGLSKRFGGFAALDDVGLTVPPGGLVGLIGPNGAGKSTLFSAVSGFIAPDRGVVRFGGRSLAGLTPATRARLGLCRTFQVPREFRHLTVRQNLAVAAPQQSGEALLPVFFAPRRVRAETAAIAGRVEALLALLRLDAVADSPAGQLSGGQKKLLELGRALMVEPRLILLDEPFAGVNPVLIEALADLIGRLNGQGIGFLVVEHNLEALSRLVGQLYVMDRGRVLASGAPGAVLADPRVREAYLGA